MKHRALLCLIVAGCATRSTTFAGHFVTGIALEGESLVVESCEVDQTTEQDPTPGIVGAVVVTLLSGGRASGGGSHTTRDLDATRCTQRRHALAGGR